MKGLIFVGFLSLSLHLSAQNISEASDTEKKIAYVSVKVWEDMLVLNDEQKEKLMYLVTQYEMNKNVIFKSDKNIKLKNKELELLEQKHHEKFEKFLDDKQIETFNTQIKSGV